MTTVSFAGISTPGAPERTSEDGWIIIEDRTPPGWLSAAVIDGASVRAMLPGLRDYLTQHSYEPKPAVWATMIVRHALERAFIRQPPANLHEVLLAANRSLRAELEAVPSLAEIYSLLNRRNIEPLPKSFMHCSLSLSTELTNVFSDLFPDGLWRSLDTRYLRLLLPACVATAVRLNLSSGAFDFAHVGDTALVKITTSGTIQILSQDQMEIFDQQMLMIAIEATQQPANQFDTITETIQTIPAVREKDILNGVRHNYIDEGGNTIKGEGCGVINGMEELNDYIYAGNDTINRNERLWLMSDGLTLPLSAPSTMQHPIIVNSLSKWTRSLKNGEPAELLRYTREMLNADMSGTIFPRVKHFDDATALTLSLI